MAGGVPENREMFWDQASAARHRLFWETLGAECIWKGLFEEDRAGCNETPCKVCTRVAASEWYALLGSGFWHSKHSRKTPAERCSAKWWHRLSTEQCFRKAWNYRRAGCGQHIVFQSVCSKSFVFLTADKSPGRETQRTFQVFTWRRPFVSPGWSGEIVSGNPACNQQTEFEQSGEDSIHLPEPISGFLFRPLAPHICKIIAANDVQEQALTKSCFDACTLWQIHGSTHWRLPNCSAGIDDDAGWLGSRSFWWRTWNIQNEPKVIPGSSCPAQVDSLRPFPVLLTGQQLSWDAPGEPHGGCP